MSPKPPSQVAGAGVTQLIGAARLLALVLAAGVGLSSTMQAAINSKLGQSLGHSFYGAAACYGVGMSVVWAATHLHSRTNAIPVLEFGKEEPQWYELCGGVCGAVYMMIAMFAVTSLGVELFFSLVVVGQLTASLTLDHVGFLGLPVSRATKTKLASLMVALLGVFASAMAEDNAPL